MKILKTDKPVIGILGSILETKNLIQGGMSRRNFTNDTCVKSIANNGGVPVIIPFINLNENENNNQEILDGILNLCDGLLFPGGADVDPVYYHETPHEKLGKVSHELDEMWLYAANFAMKAKKPMLGICRGMQLLNVAYGGTLYQDLSEFYSFKSSTPDGLVNHKNIKHLQTCARDLTTHDVNIESNTHLHEIFNCDRLSVNTMHHQAVKDTGENIIISAHADDGIIEGIESRDKLLIAVQWHPEDLINSEPVMNLLFQDLINRAKKI